MTNRMLNGLSIALFLPDLRGGGAERISVNLANGLVKLGYSVDMVLLSAAGPYLELLRSEVRVVDLQVKRIRSCTMPLVRYLKESQPDALLGCMWPLTPISVIARMLAGVDTRVYVAEHNTWSKSQVEYSAVTRCVIRKSMQFIFPSADGVIAVSNGAADDLADFAGIARDSINTIYNPVVDASVERVNQSQISGVDNWGASPFRVLTVGSLKDQKNHELLIRAFSVLAERVDAHLLILGEGQLRRKLESLVGELGLASRVSMPGFVNNPTAYYQRASLFALSSDWEGLPTVLIEALAVGTPVVSTDCPSGAREILLDGKCGELVPLGDIEALASAMLKSLSSKHDREALIKRGQDFSIENAVARYEALLFKQQEK